MQSLQFPNNPVFKFYFDIRDIETYELDQLPDGWLQSILEQARSKTYNALIRSMSTTYKFVGNGAYLCRREFFTYLGLARIRLRIELLQEDLTYKNIYTGQLNFNDESAGNQVDGFVVPSISDDFTVNIDAYDSVKFALDLQDGVNLELTPVALNETATLVPVTLSNTPGSFFYPPFNVINNQQNSIDVSVKSVPEIHFQTANVAGFGQWFFYSRIDQNLLITGSLQVEKLRFSAGVVKFSIFNNNNVEVAVLSESLDPSDAGLQNIDINLSLPLTKGESLYFYCYNSLLIEGSAIAIRNGELNLSYKTATPSSMCKALTGVQLFTKLFQAMNLNYNSLPNSPYPFQSFLLNSGVLKDVLFTSSDSIRAANGTFYKAGDTIGQGIYEVVSNDPITYNGNAFNLGDTFTFSGPTTFSGTGTIQKIQSISVGNVYNAGDTLQAGGTYLVGGNAGGTVSYAGAVYQVNDEFKYVLNIPDFTVSDSSMYVQQIAEDPKLLITLTDAFKSVLAFMGGNACLGTVPPIPATATNPAVPGYVFIEDLAYTFQPTPGKPNIDLGNVPIDWKQKLALDRLYSNIKVGSNDQQYDKVNASQEVNTTQQYTTSLLLTPTLQAPGEYKNELELISSVRTDSLGIEMIRVTQTNSTASRSDNDTFAVWRNPTVITANSFSFYRPALKADSLQSLSGVHESVYNFFLSPKTCLLRGAPYLASIFYNMGDYPIVFQSSLKNSGMVYVDNNGKRVAEADNIKISSLGKPLFIPLYYLGKQGIPYSVLNKLYANPYQDISFSINGVSLKGYIVDFKINQATNEPQDVKLMLTGDTVTNDLTQFITL